MDRGHARVGLGSSATCAHRCGLADMLSLVMIDSKLINEVLKTDLGFQGYVMSDWQAQESGVGSSLAGLDMSMVSPSSLERRQSSDRADLSLS
jgi:hypothetical protein